MAPSRVSKPGALARKGRTNKAARRGRFVVTGGAGFIGSNLVAELLRREPGCRVTVVDDFTSGSYANIVEACARRNVDFTGDVLAVQVGDWLYAAVAEPTKPTAFFHLAALTDTTVTDQQRMMEVNAGLWWPWLMDACSRDGVPLVYASSAATYGTPSQAARREAFPLEAAGRPNNVYGFSKWVLENMHREHARSARRPPWIVGLRYFNVFGPGEARKGKMASMAHQLASQVLSGKRPRLFLDGSQARDQIFVDDVVDCTLAAAGLGPRGHKITPGVYNLGSGRATTFNEVAAAVRAGLSLSRGELEVEYFAMPEDVRRFYQDFTLADMTQTRAALGWEPRHDPVEATKRYAAWLKSERR